MIPSPPPLSSLLSSSAVSLVLISISIIAFSLLLLLVAIVTFYIICDYFRHNRQSDIENGEEEERLYQTDVTSDNLEWHEKTAFYQAAVLHNMRVLEILDRVVEELEERKERRKRLERKRALEKNLPPSISYGREESEMNCKDCAICLDDFETGEMCQALASCSHAFHSKCINHWFMENLT